MHKTTATIITIGDELLIGQVVDTNSAWMAQQLNEVGIWVHKKLSIGDDAENISAALQQASVESDIILLTGGLGPTADDITKPVLCQFFGSKLVRNTEVLTHLIWLFNQFNRPLTERNKCQADLPDNCTPIFNQNGTAPGMWFEKNGKIFVSMPGVPQEMKLMMEKLVIPELIKQFKTPAIQHRTLLTVGIGESFLADLIAEWESQLPSFIKLAYLPNYSMVRLRLTAEGVDDTETEATLNHQFEQLQTLVAPYLVTNQDETLEQVIAKLMLANQKTLATAESCTGGYMAHRITSMPGSSKYFMGSIVCYSNTAKTNLLQVPKELLDLEGAVSEPVVKIMAQKTQIKLQSDYAVAVSGIMGPGGGTESKPVGTVWIAVCDHTRVETLLLKLPYGREKNIQITALQAFNRLRQFILQSQPQTK